MTHFKKATFVLVFIGIFLGIMSLAASNVTATASVPPRDKVFITIPTCPEESNGTLVVAYSQQESDNHYVLHGFQDDGHVILQVHAVNGRFGINGTWMDVPTKSGGEGFLRYEKSSYIIFDAVRVRRPHGYTSDQRPVDVC